MDFRKNVSLRLTHPVVRILARTPLTPNTLTWTGFLITVAAGSVIGCGHLFAGGWIVLFAAIFDMLDGSLARFSGKSSTFGAALDSALDRLSEAALLLGIMFWYAQQRNEWLVILAGATLVGSFMVSYIRARAEGLGLELREGIFTRAERVIVLSLGLLLNQISGILAIALGIIAILSYITAGQRLFLVWRKAKNK